MLKRTLYLSSALSLAWGVAVCAQDAEFVSPMLGFYEAGVICAPDATVTREAPDTLAGTTNVVEDAPSFVSRARLVPAVIGIGFGVRAGLASPDGTDGVTMTVTHPPLSDSGTTIQSFVTAVGGKDTPGITFYQFDYDYELALGDWTMTATVGAVTLYETTFTVVPPQALPQLAGACGYLDLLS
ncbi:DUF3859 domain-containing protein [Octadecabacter sp.]|nr:DUF3859 domain-containing protein [Octadecabacter sp.]